MEKNGEVIGGRKGRPKPALFKVAADWESEQHLQSKLDLPRRAKIALREARALNVSKGRVGDR